MKIRELLEVGEMDDAMKPGGDMGGSMAANPMTPSPTASGNMGSMGQPSAPMAGTPSPGIPSPGIPSPTAPSPGMPGGASAPMKTASNWNPLSADFWTNQKPVGGAAPADPLHGGNSAVGNSFANTVTGGMTGALSKALNPNQQQPVKPNQ